jgi:hypothetical protein
MEANNNVPFRIFNLMEMEVASKFNLEPGYYYDIPLEEQSGVSLKGPYPTKQQSIDAATDFINDALTDFQAELNGEQNERITC